MGSNSYKLYKEALEVFPGGVNSPVRASVKPYPFYVKRGFGPFIETVDGEILIDYVLGYGPLILGHNHPDVRRRVIEAISDGWLYGTPCEYSIRLAKKIVNHYGVDMVRFVNSGSEATITAIRLARGYTGRGIIVKFDGCYHGSNDYLLVKRDKVKGRVASSLGIPEEITRLTYILEYNDVDGFIGLMDKMGGDVAAVIVEPVIANTGLIPPRREFLEALRRETERHGAVLIFDEVVTGYRLSLGGASKYYSIRPDLITLGKIIGGGFPIGAIAGDRDILEMLTPKGRVFNAGTFNANPISMAAGLATIEVLERDSGIYTAASRGADAISREIEGIGDRYKVNIVVNRVENMLQFYIMPRDVGEVDNASKARLSRKDQYLEVHKRLLERNVFIPPSQYETIFLSGVHDENVVDETISKIRSVFREVVG